MTGRLHVRSKIRKRHFRRVASIAITPRESDVIRYLRTQLKDTNPDAMGAGLQVDTFRKIAGDISEMYCPWPKLTAHQETGKISSMIIILSNQPQMN